MIWSHRSQATHTCVSKLRHHFWYTGSSPGLLQANIWTRDGVLLIEPLGAHLIENSFTSLPDFKRRCHDICHNLKRPDDSKRNHHKTKFPGHRSLRWRHNGCDGVSITSLMIVYSTVDSAADQRKHQSSASLAFVRGMHRWPVNSPHKWPATRKMFPFDNVIMRWISVMS